MGRDTVVCGGHWPGGTEPPQGSRSGRGGGVEMCPVVVQPHPTGCPCPLRRRLSCAPWRRRMAAARSRGRRSSRRRRRGTACERSAKGCSVAPRPGHDGLRGHLGRAGPGPVPARRLSVLSVQDGTRSSLHREPGRGLPTPVDSSGGWSGPRGPSWSEISPAASTCGSRPRRSVRRRTESPPPASPAARPGTSAPTAGPEAVVDPPAWRG